MADATQGDTDVPSLGLLASVMINFIAGLLIHSFIIGVNVSDWWKGRSVTAVDHVVTSLGISRMCSQCVTTLYQYMFRLFLNRLDSNIYLIIISAVNVFFTYANIWLISLLSIVLCLKISNFDSRLFLYLRGVIMHRTGSLIVASGLLSAVNTLMYSLIAITTKTKGGKYNTTVSNLSTDCANINALHIYATGDIFPLSFYYISSVLLFSSLYHHTTKMKMSSNLSISLETYYSTMRFVSITFIFTTLYFICHFVGVFYYSVYCVTLHWLFIVLGILPALHSSYLIYRTAKLRSQMSKVLHNLTDLLFQREDTETRENIEIVAK